MTMISKKFPAAALIDGDWVTSAKTFLVNDPATGGEVAAVPDLGAEDAARAIDAAARALPSWSAKTAKEQERERAMKVGGLLKPSEMDDDEL